MKNKRVLMSLVMAVMLGLLTLSSVSPVTEQGSLKGSYLPTGLLAHGPITIVTEENFTDYGFDGSGTREDPYVIAGLEIVSPDGGPCISITGDIDAYYVIRNCSVSGSTGMVYENASIYLTTGSVEVSNCTVFDTSIGIFINSGNHSIETTQFYNCSLHGLVIDGCYNTTVKELDFKQPVYTTANHIEVRFSDGVSIKECSIEESLVYVHNSKNVEIEKCLTFDLHFKIHSCISGIQISENFLVDSKIEIGVTSVNVSIYENQFEGVYNPGLYATAIDIGGNNTIVLSNTFTDTERIMVHVAIKDAGYNSSISNNSIINYTRGFMVLPQSSHVVIHKNMITGCGTGIYCFGNYSTITNNTIEDSYSLGVYMTESSSMNQFYYNSITGNNESARDDGTGNVWDDGVSVGNYWGDIPSGPYSINGTANSVDRWPIVLETTSQTTPTETVIEPYTLGIISAVAAVGIIMVTVVILKKREP